MFEVVPQKSASGFLLSAARRSVNVALQTLQGFINVGLIKWFGLILRLNL
jgi:hypothetical protein